MLGIGAGLVAGAGRADVQLKGEPIWRLIKRENQKIRRNIERVYMFFKPYSSQEKPREVEGDAMVRWR